jgi:hypothetical protein
MEEFLNRQLNNSTNNPRCRVGRLSLVELRNQLRFDTLELAA